MCILPLNQRYLQDKSVLALFVALIRATPAFDVGLNL